AHRGHAPRAGPGEGQADAGDGRHAARLSRPGGTARAGQHRREDPARAPQSARPGRARDDRRQAGRAAGAPEGGRAGQGSSEQERRQRQQEGARPGDAGSARGSAGADGGDDSRRQTLVGSDQVSPVFRPGMQEASMRSGRRGAAKVIALVAFIIVILVATPEAQQTVSFSGSPGAIMAGPAAAPTDATNIDLLVGRSTILNVGGTIARVSLTVPDVADAMVTAPQQLLIHGKAPGVISMFVWDRAGGIKTYEVNVRRDLTQLVEQMRNLFPGEPV